MGGSLRWLGLAASLMAASALSGCFQSHPAGDGTCGDLCVSDTITWGYVGGLAFQFDQSELVACRTFQHSRSELDTGNELTCSNAIPACASNPSVSIEEVESALADPEVEAALAAAPVLYGNDPRPVDGQVFRIAVGDAVIEVGEPCDGSPSCDEIPNGVQMLADLLSSLTMAEISQEPCLSILLGE